jgi:hypothetical protein
MTITIHQIIDYATWTSTGLSLLYSVLPTVETFQKYPRFQSAYGLFLNVIKQVGANLRNVIYPSIKTDGGTRVSTAAASGQNPAPTPEP